MEKKLEDTGPGKVLFMKSVLQNATIEANSCQTNALLGVVNQHKDGKRKTDKFLMRSLSIFSLLIASLHPNGYQSNLND